MVYPSEREAIMPAIGREIQRGTHELNVVMLRAIGLGFSLLGLALPARVDSEERMQPYDRVEFTATANMQVTTDSLVAYLSRQSEGDSAPAAADQVNKAISQALKHIKQTPDVKAEVAEYQTSPLYQDERLVGWRVRQTMRLASGNFARIGALIGDLQQTLSVDELRYDVSPEALKRAEDSLTDQALKAFQQRAEQITRGLGRARYRIVSMRISNADAPIQPAMLAARQMPMADGIISQPNVEPSDRKVQINVTGTIELQTE